MAEDDVVGGVGQGSNHGGGVQTDSELGGSNSDRDRPDSRPDRSERRGSENCCNSPVTGFTER